MTRYASLWKTQNIFGEKAARHSAGRTRQNQTELAAAAGVVHAGDVFRHELWFHQLQRTRQFGESGGGTGHSLYTGEGGLHEDFYQYGKNTIVQVASGRFGVHKDYLEAGAAIEIKIGQGAKPGIGGHLPGTKIVGDVSKTRMIPEGSDAISPGAAPRYLFH